MKLVFSCVIIILNINIASSITLLHQSDDEGSNFKCVSESNKTLTWITPLKKQFANHLNKSLTEIKEYVGIHESWLRETFDETNLNGGYILDEQWQSFQIQVTNGQKSKSYTEFIKFGRLKQANAPFSFSVRIKSDAHLYLCQDENSPPYNHCYWIIIGGWRGEKSVIRKCRRYEIPSKNDEYPIPPCSDIIDNVTGNPLNANEWKHFNVEISKNYLNIYIYGQNEPFLKIEYDNQLPYETIYIKSDRDNIGFWKLHSYTQRVNRNTNAVSKFMDVQSGQNICFTMYASFCKDCHLLISLTDENSVIYRQFHQILEGNWVDIVFNQSVPESTSRNIISINIVPPEMPIVLIRNIKMCSEDLNIISLQLPSQANKNVSCTYLINPTDTVAFDKGSKKKPKNSIEPFRSKPPINCSYNQFGKKCIACKKIYQKEFCEKTIICESKGCYCAPGYKGKYCDIGCPNGNFGFDCGETCGNCSHGTCNKINGTCYNGCTKPFSGAQCKEILLPIIKSAPKLKSECYTKCEIEFNLMDFVGKIPPISYKLQLFKYTWRNIHEGNIKDNSYIIDNLSVSNEYVIRIILCTKDECFDGLVPNTTITTKCKEMVKEDITLTTDRTSAKINVKNNLEMCQLNNYVYYREGGRRVQVLSENVVNNLLPYTNYTLFVAKQRNIIFQIEFQTEEDKPSIVQNVKATPTETNVYLKWHDPSNPNGRIKAYNISYQFYSKVDGCKTDDNIQITTFSTAEKEYTIVNLKPYSIYNISITAINTYEGYPYRFGIETLPSKEINVDSYIVKSVTTTSNNAKIMFEKICEKVQSPAYFSAKAKCSRAWCTNKQHKFDTKIYNTNPILNIYDLLPFTNYTVDVFISRETETNSPILLSSENFTTKPDRPMKLQNIAVYCRRRQNDKDYFWFKWDEPYPPTGILEEIRHIRTTYSYFGTPSSAIDRIIPRRCEIWTNKYCATITYDNTYTEYTLNFQAKNKDVSTYSDDSLYSLKINDWMYAETQGPQNLEYEWERDFSLLLKWQHPEYVNYKFQGFDIFIINQRIIINQTENHTYSYKYVFDENSVIKKEDFLIEIQTKSTSDTSEKFYLKVKSPPMLPKLEQTPTIVKVQNHSISIKIPKIKYAHKESLIFVVVTQEGIHTNKNNKCDLGKLQLDIHEKKKWIAIQIQDVNVENVVEIGGGMSMFSNFLNCYLDNSNLDVGNKYTIDVISMNIRNNFTRYFNYTLVTSTGMIVEGTEGSSALAISMIILILSIICISIAIFYIRKNKIRLPSLNMTAIPIRKESSQEPLPVNQDIQIVENNQNRIDLNEFSCYTKVVDIANLENYIRQSIQTGELEKQHASLKSRDDILCTYGKKIENKSKNRYANIIPFDHNRVILNKINNDPFSDYINANYINGINCAKAYIAAQAPKSNTLNDFWRMIWEQKVEHIIMLTSIYEGSKKKSEKYWPEVGEELEFGGIMVEHLSLDVYPDFQSRVLMVKYDGLKRKINHLYYTNWPDHDVPLYPYSLVQFVGKILSIPEGKSPVLVHCSAGVGRTGTIILIDLCLRMIDKHGVMDIFYHQKQLREQRPNMVDSAQQYKFAHLVLLECLVTPKTEIECNEDFEAAVENVDVQAQIEYIANSAWYENVLIKKSKFDIIMDPDKNRFQDIVPENYGIIYLSPTSNQTSSYINAVTVDNFMLQNQFIATQQPMPQTVTDFWRLIYEYDIEVIISLQEIDLNDPTCCEFWPSAASEKMAHLSKNVILTYLKTEAYPGYELITINMKYKKESRSVTIIALKNWHYGQDCPENSNVFLTICTEMHRLVSNSNKIVVTCKDGASGCGLYIAMCFLLEKIKFEQICDVCHTVRIIRRSRKQFIPNEEQFSYLYEIAKLYMKEFEIYSNFSK